MTDRKEKQNFDYLTAIRASEFSIYDIIEVGDSLWIPSADLEKILNKGMKGFKTAGVPLRTRSKLVKKKVCEVLGYPVPQSFRKCQPRFLGQNFDTYVQSSNNLQIWNEELSPIRRYVLIRENEKGVVSCVKVVTGVDLALLDKTGTLTQKYQARLIPSEYAMELISSTDTERLINVISSVSSKHLFEIPTDYPSVFSLLSIGIIFERLKVLIGSTFQDVGINQERNRGAQLHRLVCSALGYASYKDDGRFPDVRHQLLEVKLQTSSTIDLGLVTPQSEEPLDIPKMGGMQIRHCDVRYAIFYGKTDGEKVTLTNFYLTTGRDFFTRFPQFQGKVLNKKLQIRLPNNFFT